MISEGIGLKRSSRVVIWYSFMARKIHIKFSKMNIFHKIEYKSDDIVTIAQEKTEQLVLLLSAELRA